jgi:hypothetical protein
VIKAIRDIVMQRRITRLCHFTPSRNLVHIATDPQGILASVHLKENEKAIFNPTDVTRLDGYPDHVSCSIQYPNAWYFRKARDKDHLFRDWVVLLIKPHHLWMSETKFCARNASANLGGDVCEGLKGFMALFAENVVGAYGQTFTRSLSHPSWLPTDEQAEVLIPDRVEREDVLGIVVLDESQAKREIVRLRQLNERVPRIVVAPTFYDAKELSKVIRSGTIPTEREYYPGDEHV